MHRVMILLALSTLLVVPQFQVRAQSGTIQVENVNVDFTFGDHVTILASIQPASEVKEVLLTIQVDGDAAGSITIPLQVGNDGSIAYQLPIQNSALQPFARVHFQFIVSLNSGETFTSALYFFDYFDNRMAWQTRRDGKVIVHWYDGDNVFGQAALETTRASLQSISALIPVAIPDLVNVYIYATSADLQNAIGGQAWIAGRASPEVGVILVSITPGQDQMLTMRRQIPHEMAHVLLYEYAGAGYNQLPSWLNEGIASLAELYPNADYQNVVQTAGANNSLLPLTSLCGPFPQDASSAFLAYAESDRVTRYIQSTYGTSSLEALVLAYANNLGCEQGTQQALGISLSQLDLRWRQDELGGQASSAAFQNLLPYLLVMLILLIVTALGIGILPKLKK